MSVTYVSEGSRSKMIHQSVRQITCMGGNRHAKFFCQCPNRFIFRIVVTIIAAGKQLPQSFKSHVINLLDVLDDSRTFNIDGSVRYYPCLLYTSPSPRD